MRFYRSVNTFTATGGLWDTRMLLWKTRQSFVGHRGTLSAHCKIFRSNYCHTTFVWRFVYCYYNWSKTKHHFSFHNLKSTVHPLVSLQIPLRPTNVRLPLKTHRALGLLFFQPSRLWFSSNSREYWELVCLRNTASSLVSICLISSLTVGDAAFSAWNMLLSRSEIPCALCDDCSCRTKVHWLQNKWSSLLKNNVYLQRLNGITIYVIFVYAMPLAGTKNSERVVATVFAWWLSPAIKLQQKNH